MAAGAGDELLLLDTALLEVVPGLEGFAPFSNPWEVGTRYVVAEIVVSICGKPDGPAPRLIAFSVISLPLTATWLLLTVTNAWSRRSRSARLKKLPWKVRVKFSVGKPAGPTVAPGGSEPEAPWPAELAEADGVEALGADGTDVLADELDPEGFEGDEPALELEEEPGVEGAGVGAAVPPLPACSTTLRKSTCAALAALWSS
jgi:hypothetical protein